MSKFNIKVPKKQEDITSALHNDRITPLEAAILTFHLKLEEEFNDRAWRNKVEKMFMEEYV